MINQIRKKISKSLINIPGWRTDRKIVVFESDDWGTIRMSSENDLLELSNLGVKIHKCHYTQNDALASEKDLNQLFDTLCSYQGSQGEHPVITANVIMANPDFKKIKVSNFTEYHNEIFTETLDRYSEHKNSFNLWKDGINENLFHPQFHGREHLQVLRWMNYLRNSSSDTRKAFERGVFGLSTSVTSEERKSYMASYDWDDTNSRNFILESISDGLSLFKSLFGFESLSSIAPNYTWSYQVEEILRNHGVRFLQGGAVQKIPEIGNKFKKKRHYTGQNNKLGQTYLVRNCKFEPSSNQKEDWVERCLNDIKTAFFWKKPAIIEMHRVNFIGYINSENRERNLKKLNQLLKRIIKKWPEVEFMTSDQLGKLIESDE